MNIGREHAGDPHYRYQRDGLDIGHSGKGKNQKTQLLNLEQIAKSLYSRPEYLIKFFGHRCGTLSGIDTKSGEWFMKGDYSVTILEELLEEYIDTYTLCPSCRGPETALKVKKGSLRMACYSCGAKSKCADETILSVVARIPQDESKMYRAYIRRTAAGDSVAITSGAPAEDDDAALFYTDTSPEAVQARMQECLRGAVGKLEDDDEVDDAPELDIDAI